MLLKLSSNVIFMLYLGDIIRHLNAVTNCGEESFL